MLDILGLDYLTSAEATHEALMLYVREAFIIQSALIKLASRPVVVRLMGLLCFIANYLIQRSGKKRRERQKKWKEKKL